MNRSTLILEVHAFRRPGIYGGELGRALCLGFVSATYIPMLLSEWIKKRLTGLRDVAGTRGFVEMAAYGEDRCKRINGGKPLHVPSRREK